MTSAEFTVKLRRLVDPALTCYWNPLKGRFVIDRCTNPEASSGLHTCTFECLKTNVMLVEDNGAYRDLGDDIIGYLQSIDAWSNYKTLEGMDAAEKAMEDADQAQRAKAIDSTYKELAADNKKQLREAFHLIQQHDTARINQ